MNIIYPKIYTNRTYSNHKCLNTQPSFSAQLTAKDYNKAMRFIDEFLKTRPHYYEYSTAHQLPLDRINGIQFGLPIFGDEHIGDIMAVFKSLRGILLSRGCSNQCGHCFINALPRSYDKSKYVYSMPWEDFVGIMDGIKKLSDRFKTSVLKPSEYSYPHTDFEQPMNLFLDTDCMDIVLRDKQGKFHEYPEIVTKLYESTGKKTVFDTGSWNYKSKSTQERAERYVEFFAKPDTQDKMRKINLSMNPFHSIYMKSLELGYNPISDVCNDIRTQKGKAIYQEYLNRMANMLVTFSPLKNKSKFGIILRVLDDKVPNMEGFRESDYKKVLRDILKRTEEMLQNDLKTNRKYVKSERDINKIILFYECKFFDPEKNIDFSGRFEKLFRKRNPNIAEEEIKKLFPDHYLLDGCYIDVNGDVYIIRQNKLSSKFSMLNTSNKNKPTRPLDLKPY